MSDADVVFVCAHAARKLDVVGVLMRLAESRYGFS